MIQSALFVKRTKGRLTAGTVHSLPETQRSTPSQGTNTINNDNNNANNNDRTEKHERNMDKRQKSQGGNVKGGTAKPTKRANRDPSTRSVGKYFTLGALQAEALDYVVTHSDDDSYYEDQLMGLESQETTDSLMKEKERAASMTVLLQDNNKTPSKEDEKLRREKEDDKLKQSTSKNLGGASTSLYTVSSNSVPPSIEDISGPLGPEKPSAPALSNAVTSTSVIPPPTQDGLARHTRAAPISQPGAVAVPGMAAFGSRPVQAPSSASTQSTSQTTPQTVPEDASAEDGLIAAELVDSSNDLMVRVRQLEERQREIEKEKLEMLDDQSTNNPDATQRSLAAETIIVKATEEKPPAPRTCLWATLFFLVVAIGAALVVVFVVVLPNKNEESPTASPQTSPASPPVAMPTGMPSETPSSSPTVAPNRTEIVLAQVYSSIPYSNLSQNALLSLAWLDQDTADTSVLNTQEDVDEGTIINVELLLERFALVKLFHDLQGFGWFAKTNWLSHAHSTCNWLGLTCNGLGKITNIQGSGGRLRGALPTELGLLRKLSYIELFENFITGTIPTEIGLLSNMEVLDIHANALSGTIPTEIGNLRRMDYVDFDENCLTGTFPTELGRLTNLNDLYISANLITGSMDPIFCNNRVNFPVLPYLITDCNLPEVTCSCCQICCNQRFCRGDGCFYDVELPEQCSG